MRGRELLRRLFQDRLDLMAAQEERWHEVTGEGGVARMRAEKGETLPLVTKLGQVTCRGSPTGRQIGATCTS